MRKNCRFVSRRDCLPCLVQGYAKLIGRQQQQQQQQQEVLVCLDVAEFRVWPFTPDRAVLPTDRAILPHFLGVQKIRHLKTTDHHNTI